MAVRRKSNWYIYLVAFVITFALAAVAVLVFKEYLFPTGTTNVAVNVQGTTNENFTPTAEHNFNSMLMIGEDDPELFVLMEYNAVNNRVTFVPIPNGISVAGESRTLPNVYTAQGAGGVLNVINNAIGVKCDFYIKVDRAGFENFVTGFGSVQYDIPKTVVIRYNNEIESIAAGTQVLTASSIFNLMMHAEFDEGEAYRFNNIGGLLSDLVNQNYRSLNSSLLDLYYRSLCEVSENNISEEKYNAHKSALLYTVEYGSYPAEFYVPYGDYSSDGGFAIAENSADTIKQKAE